MGVINFVQSSELWKRDMKEIPKGYEDRDQMTEKM